MKLFNSLLLIALLFVVLKVNAEVCDDDEECRPIEECPREQRMIRQGKRQGERVKICGIGPRTRDHCCKILSISRIELVQAETTEPELEEVDATTTDEPATGDTTLVTTNKKPINSKYCGNSLSDRIVGGEKAKVMEFPWLVLLQYRSKDDEEVVSFKCGGSLITERYVLTAAHCLNQENDDLFSVRLGEHTISKDVDCNNYTDSSTCNSLPVEDIPIENFTVHEDYSSSAEGDDIALIRLSRDVILSRKKRHIRTICLPVEESQNIDKLAEDVKMLIIAGWGYSEYEKKMSDVLMKADVPYLNQSMCVAEYDRKMKKHSLLRIRINDNQMCAGGAGHIDTCKGDSGSALMGFAEMDEHFKLFQHGIVSLGVDCSIREPFPGVFTRVANYMNWILENISAN